MGHKTARKVKQVRLQTRAADTRVKVDPPRRYNAQLRNESEPPAEWHTHTRRPPTRGLRKITKKKIQLSHECLRQRKHQNETRKSVSVCPVRRVKGFSSYLKRQVSESVAA